MGKSSFLARHQGYLAGVKIINVKKTIAVVLAGSALVLSLGSSCGNSEEPDDRPGIEDTDDEGDDD